MTLCSETSRKRWDDLLGRIKTENNTTKTVRPQSDRRQIVDKTQKYHPSFVYGIKSKEGKGAVFSSFRSVFTRRSITIN